MSPATRYDLVTLLHVSCDIVFVASMLAATFVLAALSLQTPAQLQKDRRLVGGMWRWNQRVTGSVLTVAWLCGLWLAWQVGWWTSGWLQAKLVIVFALSGLHGAASAALRRAHADAPVPPGRAWRAAPALLLGGAAAVVWLAWTKPF